MEISPQVEAKISEDEELLALLKSAQPNEHLHRTLMIYLDMPELPKQPEGAKPWEFRKWTPEEEAAYTSAASAVVEKAEQGLRIDGLRIFNLMRSAGAASVTGTAEALVKALELDSVRAAVMDDRQIIRGAMERG